MKLIYTYLNRFFAADKKQVIFISLCPKKHHRAFAPRIKASFNLNWEIISCDNWTDVECALNKNPQALMIHYSKILDEHNSVAEFIHNLKIFIKTKAISDRIQLAVSIDSNSPKNVINELIGSKYIKTVVPSSIDFGYSEYIYSINALLYRSCFCPQRILDLLPSAVNQLKTSISKKSNIDNLTPRQKEIAVLISKNGFSNKKIARALGISESSVKFHVTKIFKKYNITNRSQLTNNILTQK